jgi:hypothetical protein
MTAAITGFLHALVLWIHPIHVTVTEMELDEKDKRIEIMMRIFIDDFETTLRTDLRQPELDILEPKNGLTTDQIADKYIQQHFKLSVDGKVVKTNYLGHEKEGDAFIFYIEAPNVKKLKTISVQNDAMAEMFDDQSNLVHMKVKGVTKSLRLTRDNISDQLTFENK